MSLYVRLLSDQTQWIYNVSPVQVIKYKDEGNSIFPVLTELKTHHSDESSWSGVLKIWIAVYEMKNI